ncbi:MAG: putative DNA-binding transcriptional regulator [Sphingobacteriaceae bacterium]|nr:putative DNA-binding transcriptional regulator [Sphingobacteriaceae bacterium]
MGKELSIEQKKELAKLLYTKEGITTQKELALRVGVSERTMSKWVNSESWETLRESLVVTKEQQLRMLYMQLTELTDNINSRTEGSRFPNSKEADVYVKLTSAIKQMESENSIADIIEVAKGFLNFLRVEDFELSQRVGNFFDGFIKQKLNENKR